MPSNEFKDLYVVVPFSAFTNEKEQKKRAEAVQAFIQKPIAGLRASNAQNYLVFRSQKDYQEALPALSLSRAKNSLVLKVLIPSTDEEDFRLTKYQPAEGSRLTDQVSAQRLQVKLKSHQILCGYLNDAPKTDPAFFSQRVIKNNLFTPDKKETTKLGKLLSVLKKVYQEKKSGLFSSASLGSGLETGIEASCRNQKTDDEKYKAAIQYLERKCSSPVKAEKDDLRHRLIIQGVLEAENIGKTESETLRRTPVPRR